MESIEDDSSEMVNKLEITRNPFDSQIYDKENFPILDASIFVDATTPQRKSTDTFRWSIDQIAKLKPAQMDLFPNQEYSVNYERKEDEERDQKEVDEYFKNVLLPSPWLDNRSEVLKRVTFSPHPPATRYISEQNNISLTSNNMSTSPPAIKENLNDTTTPTMLSDACCQTMLTFPVNLDVQAIINSCYYSYTEDSTDAKELMISSLRRKLFGQDAHTPSKENHLVVSSPKMTPSYITSSPTKESVVLQRRSASVQKDEHNIDVSPSISPLKSTSTGSTPSVFSNDEFSPKQASNIGTPAHLRETELSFSSVDVSPIHGHKNNIEEESNYSFLPNVSFDINGTESQLHDYSRNYHFASPGISPIKNDNKDASEFPASITNTDSLEILENAQSIKESTARNIHAFTSLDLSSINDCSKPMLKDVPEDAGPLEITELTSSNENDDVPLSAYFDEDEENPDILDITDLCITPATQPPAKNNHSADRLTNIENTPLVKECSDGKSELLPLVVSPSHVTSDSLSTTPLKGILKHRENVTPKRTNLRGLDFEESTRYNTVCNSGKRTRSPKRAFTQIIPQFDVIASELPKPILTEKPVHRNTTEPYDSPELDIAWRKSHEIAQDTTLSEDFVCIRANSVLKRAHRFTHSFEKEFSGDKENREESSRVFRRNIQLNSTEITGHSMELMDNGSNFPSASSIGIESSPFNNTYSGDIRPRMAHSDSGVSSMEWTGANNEKRAKLSLHSSISPLMRLNQLTLTGRKNTEHGQWGNKRHLDRPGSAIRLSESRLMLHRSYTWPNKEKLRSCSPVNLTAPRSRVLAKYRSRYTSSSFKNKSHHFEPYNPITSAFKDLLPSPLK